MQGYLVKAILAKGGGPIDFKQRSIGKAKDANGEKGGNYERKGRGKGRKGKDANPAVDATPAAPAAGGGVKLFCNRKLCTDQSCLDTKDHTTMAKHLQSKAAATPCTRT